MTSARTISAPLLERQLQVEIGGHFAGSVAAARTFFQEHAEAIAHLCERMATRFERGGTLLVFGDGAQASDAAHVSVEFVHPVLVGKRALPAIAVTLDSSANVVNTLGTPNDIALALCAATPGPAMQSALAAARARGLLTVLLAGAQADSPGVEVCFVIPAANALIVQETHETLYHVLWELVHAFFDGRGFASPFALPDRGVLLRDVSQSTRQKSQDICALRSRVYDEQSTLIASAAVAAAERFARGGRLLAFGNGGSATDALDAAADCMTPPVSNWRRLPALALSNDIGIVTGVANDVGFDHVFSRQILAFGRSQDIAFGFSTSGASKNVLQAMESASKRGLLTIALSGAGGGALAASAAVDYCVTAGSDYVPRIQEAHATVWHALLSAIHVAMRHGSDAGGGS